MLEGSQASSVSPYVFADGSGFRQLSICTLENRHKRIRQVLGLLAGAVIHSFRHTFGSRLGEAGADSFTIMRAMGHSGVTVSQKYVHPTPGATDRAYERLDAVNQRTNAVLTGSEKRQLPAAIPATVSECELE